MKIIRGLAVILVIFVLPAGSWYYLQQGYNYRLGALQELEPKGQFVQLSIEEARPELFGEKITLICMCDEASVDELTILNNLEEKSDSNMFQIVRLKNRDIDSQLLHDKYGEDKLILVDKDREYRKSYGFEQVALNELVKHVAIITPLPARQKIKLKRQG